MNRIIVFLIALSMTLAPAANAADVCAVLFEENSAVGVNEIQGLNGCLSVIQDSILAQFTGLVSLCAAAAQDNKPHGEPPSGRQDRAAGSALSGLRLCGLNSAQQGSAVAPCLPACISPVGAHRHEAAHHPPGRFFDRAVAMSWPVSLARGGIDGNAPLFAAVLTQSRPIALSDGIFICRELV